MFDKRYKLIERRLWAPAAHSCSLVPSNAFVKRTVLYRIRFGFRFLNVYIFLDNVIKGNLNLLVMKWLTIETNLLKKDVYDRRPHIPVPRVLSNAFVKWMLLYPIQLSFRFSNVLYLFLWYIKRACESVTIHSFDKQYKFINCRRISVWERLDNSLCQGVVWTTTSLII